MNTLRISHLFGFRKVKESGAASKSCAASEAGLGRQPAPTKRRRDDKKPGHFRTLDDNSDEDEDRRRRVRSAKERRRIAQIMGHPAADEDLQLAADLALKTELSSADAIATLENAREHARRAAAEKVASSWEVAIREVVQESEANATDPIASSWASAMAPYAVQQAPRNARPVYQLPPIPVGTETRWGR